MSNFIKEPLKHPEWDPSKGDYYNKSLFAEDKQHEKNIFRKKLLISSLALAHIVALVLIFVYFS
jgi:hypothetical protein